MRLRSLFGLQMNLSRLKIGEILMQWRSGFLLCLASLVYTGVVSAQEAQAIFRRAGESVFVVDAKGPANTSQGSAVAFSNSFDKTGSDPRSWKTTGTYFATNFHVVEGASTITLRKGARRFTARLDFGDKAFDFAILHVSEGAIPPVETGNFSDIQVGDRVYAIGSPLGLENSISEGIVSGKRTLNDAPLIQTTAPISRGNSGGGLFDKSGKLLGLTTFKLMGGENINFALDIGLIKQIDKAKLAAWYLNNRFSDRLTSEQKQLLNSDQFSGWLLKMGSNSMRIYEEVSASIDSVTKGRIAPDEGYKVMEGIVNAFLTYTNQNSARVENVPSGGRTSAITVVCRLPENVVRVPITLHLNFEDKLVNEQPAMINDEIITWLSVDKSTRYILERASGKWFSSVKTGSWQTLGECARAEQKRF